ncbi:MAG TPA: hypothetical protein VE944_23915 [Nostoc sp.]|uniref:hypothetical protein n=1 Tax=Nostoc sp. TaxID=1180 RepID=UPI002D33F89B|nr:hypothetical protein [Nostoc sp.]HYX17343.1 hypothetical protein [Nostoc sp.]
MSQPTSEEPLPNPEGASWRLIYTKQAQIESEQVVNLPCGKSPGGVQRIPGDESWAGSS